MQDVGIYRSATTSADDQVRFVAIGDRLAAVTFYGMEAARSFKTIVQEDLETAKRFEREWNARPDAKTRYCWLHHIVRFLLGKPITDDDE